ncbi:MAG TPA: tetratricopeptide repeat protein [Candidatus Sulfotelmatobacter sp.]|jgi:hypothetical protein|nr:tetratricopeptide repeat protein [Candidatus Sulfotelmatobacter sp.]
MHSVAVVLPTTLRPTLLRAARSVFAQKDVASVQLLIGVDTTGGDPAMLEQLRRECPQHVVLTVLDLGYSTSTRHGGFYPNHYSGALRTILSYAANAPYVAYLDDDDWWAHDHLCSLLDMIAGRDWAFSYRWIVDRETGWPICRDEWDSVGPGRGINQARYGGFCCPSTLMLSKQTCHFVFPHWSLAAFSNGTGEDRLVFDELIKSANWASTGRHSCFYEMSAEGQSHPHHAPEFAARSIRWNLERDLIPDIRRHFGAAQSALAAGELAAATQSCRAALALQPHHGESLLCLALTQWAAGRMTEAGELLGHALEVACDNPAVAESWEKFSALS